ncbi:MAG TPA: hypothetical protein VFM37_14305, partial [Pseudonocardiaceae bacterium]|nr:hypothetical protein [Pseudonocardiaceae bacterium]
MRTWGRPVRLAASVSEAQLAAEAARVRAEVDRARVRAQWERERAAAERQAALDADRVAREHARERAQERARERAERRAARRVVCGRLLARVRLLVPLLVVNAAAVYGQLAYAFGEIAPGWWAWPARLALAVLFAAAVESIAVYVGWHAHDALLAKATVTAARLRRASYLIAAAVAGINYAHFAGPGLVPNAAAVAFGLLSLLSPWLWGLHTRRVQHVQLQDSGIIDGTGAVFSAERYRAFPVRTWAARRWSIDHNVTDPTAAWAGYNTARAAYRQAYPTGRARTAWAALRGQLATVAVPVTAATPVAEGV